MTFMQMVANALAIFSGPTGGGLVILGVIVAAIYSIFHHSWWPVGTALGASAFLVGAAWVGQTIFGVTGG